MSRVERVRTPVSQEQLSNALIEAWRQLFSNEPTKEQILLILAHNAIETGHRQSMWNYNIGNITTGGKSSDYFDGLKTKEQMSPGKWEEKYLKYKAYPSLLAGAIGYLKFLSTNKRYGNAWKHILNPDPIAYSKELKKAKYYTVDEEPYTKSLKSAFDNLTKGKGNVKNIKPKVKKDKIDVNDELIKKYLFTDMPTANNQIQSTLNEYLKQVSANNKDLYNKYLDNNIFTIKILSHSMTNSIEFGRILCMAIEEELGGKGFIHSNGLGAEIECEVSGPETDCLNAVDQLAGAVASTFKKATIKMGGANIKYQVLNKSSSYDLISSKVASQNYTNFLNKFKESK